MLLQPPSAKRLPFRAKLSVFMHLEEVSRLGSETPCRRVGRAVSEEECDVKDHCGGTKVGEPAG